MNYPKISKYHEYEAVPETQWENVSSAFDPSYGACDSYASRGADSNSYVPLSGSIKKEYPAHHACCFSIVEYINYIFA